MKSVCVRLSILALVLTATPAFAAEKELNGFGVLQAPRADGVKALAQDWLKSVNKTDASSQQAFNEIWGTEDSTLLDKVTATFVLGSPDAAKLMKEARDPNASAPKEVPGLLKDIKQSPFLRANLALAYAKALSNRRIYEESLETLKTVRAEMVVDPAAYFFHRAVAEHALIHKAEAEKSINRLLDDVADAPERYKRVAGLMYADMAGWKEKMDLGHIGRLMGNVERRLDLARGGPQTQKTEREIIHRLDEIIKQLEKQQQGGGGGGGGGANGGACPGGSSGDGNQPGNTNNPSSPQKDSMGGTNGGPGNVNGKDLRNTAENWGKLPPKERTSAKQDMVRTLPTTNRQQIEDYGKKISQVEKP
jgi:hypothetical protein